MEINKNELIVIDGSMSTALEHMGLDLNNELWTARALIDHPDMVKQVHIDYLEAGADCGITCSYQATIPGLIKIGFSLEQAKKAIINSVELFKQAREQYWKIKGKDNNRIYPICLAGIGPYGAYLADGSEYRGDYQLTDQQLYDFHQLRAQLLWEAGCDFLLFETQPCLQEVLVEAKIAEELKADYWISFSCKDEKHINDGHEIKECINKLKNFKGLKAVGVNCSKPEYIVGLIKEIKQVTDLPIFVYPNGGDVYDADTKTWKHREDQCSFYDYAYSYYQAGAWGVGGCCTTCNQHIQQVLQAKQKYCEVLSNNND